MQRSPTFDRKEREWTGCDLGWMVEAKNFAKIIEGKYHEEERVAA